MTATPRFSTAAESRWYAAQGWDLVSTTPYPEAVLARELGREYACVALVTDHDVGLSNGRKVLDGDIAALLDQYGSLEQAYFNVVTK